MSGYTNSAVVGAGDIGRYIVEQLLKKKAAGTAEIVVLTRQVKNPSKTCIMRDMLSIPLAVDNKGSRNIIQGDAEVIHVNYSNDESIKHALTGVDVIISIISGKALDVQPKLPQLPRK